MGGGKGSGSTVVRRSQNKPTRLSNKQIDAMTRAQVMKAARSAFIAKEIAMDTKHGQGKFTGVPITEQEASRRFDIMAQGKSLKTLRAYVKSNKSLVSADALPKQSATNTQTKNKATTEKPKNTARKASSSSHSKKNAKVREVRAMKAPKDGAKKTVYVGNGRMTVSKTNGSYKVSVSPSLAKYASGKRSFTSRLWSEIKAFLTDIVNM